MDDRPRHTDEEGHAMAGMAPRRAAETEVIRRLEKERDVLADSWRLRRRLEAWAADDPRLAFEDGHRLVAAAQTRNATTWWERDQVLASLLNRYANDRVARRVALQIVLPGVKSLIDGLRGWDVDERAARVVATAVEVLAHCAKQPAQTPPSFRVYANTRRRVLRAAIRQRSEPVWILRPCDNGDCGASSGCGRAFPSPADSARDASGVVWR